MMDAESYGMAKWLLENPEKTAMGVVMLAGVWRILWEIWKDVRGKKDELLIETMLRENHELRERIENLEKNRREPK